MRFAVAFYQTADGDEPVSDFLDDLRRTQPALHRLLIAKIELLEDSRWHRPPHTEKLEDNIFELRIGRKDIARVLFFFAVGRTIILTNGYVKKQQKLDPRELARAREYKRDWERRR